MLPDGVLPVLLSPLVLPVPVAVDVLGVLDASPVVLPPLPLEAEEVVLEVVVAESLAIRGVVLEVGLLAEPEPLADVPDGVLPVLD